MIGRVEETSASFEARSAPRLYPTEGLGVKFPVAADKAANLVGERPMPSIARFGRLAYPMRGEVTNRVVLGRKRHGRPGIRNGWPAVGTTWVAANSEA